MPAEQIDSLERDQRLQDVVLAYLQAIDAGQKPDQQDLLARHPDLAADLRAFFSGQHKIRAGMAPLRGVLESKSSPPFSKRFFADYELLQEIGHGGMGIVYEARQSRPKRIVALKMIRAGQLASSDDVRRFRAEAEIAATLDHPNIVPIYEVGERDGQHYFTMKRIQGGSLAQRLQLFAQKERASARLVAKVARAVHHAHQRGILHRDLKPANILLDSRRQPHVTDFGLAKRVEGGTVLTQTGVLVGTISNMAPEQATGKKQLTTAVDVYGVGTILYELLTGQPPFSAPTLVETLRLVLDKEPPRPRTLNPRLDRDLETICLKCLEKDPVKRYASAEALAEDLDYWLSDEPIEGRRSSIWERARKWAKRNPMVATLAGAIAMALLGMIGLMVILWVSTEKRAMAVREREIAETQRVEVEREKFELEREKENYQKRIAEVEDQLFRRDVPAAIYSKYVGFIYAVAISPDEKQIAFAVEGHPVSIYDTSTRQEIFTIQADSWIVQTIAYSHNGKYIATGGTDGILRVWLAKNGEKQFELPGHTRGIIPLVFSPDDKLLATSGWDGTVRLWDRVARKGVWFTKSQGDNIYVGPVAFRPDGKRLLSVAKGIVKVWEVETGREIPSLKIGDGSSSYGSALFSADGQQLICAADKKVSVCDANTGKETLSLDGTNGNIALSEDGKFLAAGFGDNTVKVLDTKTCKEIVVLQGGALEGIRGPIALSPDGNFLAAASADNKVKVFDLRLHAKSLNGKLVESKEIMVLNGNSSPIGSLIFSRTGKLLVGLQCPIPGYVLVWDLEAAKQQATAKRANE